MCVLKSNELITKSFVNLEIHLWDYVGNVSWPTSNFWPRTWNGLTVHAHILVIEFWSIHGLKDPKFREIVLTISGSWSHGYHIGDGDPFKWSVFLARARKQIPQTSCLGNLFFSTPGLKKRFKWTNYTAVRCTRGGEGTPVATGALCMATRVGMGVSAARGCVCDGRVKVLVCGVREPTTRCSKQFPIQINSVWLPGFCHDCCSLLELKIYMHSYIINFFCYNRLQSI